MQRPRVLVVDDEVSMLRVLERMLRSLGLDAVVAHSPIGALEYLERETFDVIISDIEMPAMFGTELAKRIRDRGITTPILMMSGNASVSGPFLEKPFTVHDLAQMLSSLGVDVPTPPRRRPG